MTKDNKIRFRSIYKILLSISIILAGICLVIGCVSIYFAGNGYSREIVSATFSKINIPVYMCLGLVVGDAVWELISPTPKKQKAFVKKVDDTKVSTTTDNKTKITRLVILGVAITVLILGFAFGGYADVLTKAAKICQECIGLG